MNAREPSDVSMLLGHHLACNSMDRDEANEIGDALIARAVVLAVEAVDNREAEQIRGGKVKLAVALIEELAGIEANGVTYEHLAQLFYEFRERARRITLVRS